MAALLAFIAPPLAFLYIQRPVGFALTVVVSAVMAALSLHTPWIWRAFALLMAACVGATAARLTRTSSPAWYASTIGMLTCVLIVTSTAAITLMHVVDVHRITSASMAPGLRVNDLVIVPKWRDPEVRRGRRYTFRFDGDEAIYIKPLVGLPGDTVTMAGNLFQVNGQRTISPAKAGKVDEMSDSLDGTA